MFRFIQTLLVKLEGLHDELKEKATKEIELGDYDIVDSLCGLLKSVEYHEDNLRTNPTDETVANAQHFLESYSQLNSWAVCSENGDISGHWMKSSRIPSFSNLRKSLKTSTTRK